MCKIALSISSIVRFLNVICKSIILKFNYKKRLTILNVDCDPNLNVLLYRVDILFSYLIFEVCVTPILFMLLSMYWL